jgi:hypothetical protein
LENCIGEKTEREREKQKLITHYEGLILTENATKIPNERNVTYWVGQIKALTNILSEKKEQDLLNKASKFSFFDTVSFLFISKKFQITYFSQHLISDISMCLQILLGLLSAFEERVA